MDEKEELLKAIGEEFGEMIGDADCNDHVDDAEVFVDQMRARGYVIIKSGFIPR